MCDTVFTIGQRGGYYLSCPSRSRYGRLPEKLRVLFEKEEIASVVNVSLGQDGVCFIAYKGKDGQDHFRSAGLPQSLREFLNEKNSEGKFVRSFPHLRVTLGPSNDSFFATDRMRMRWLNLPKGLSDALDRRLDDSGNWTDAPRLVTLGAHNNYLMITKRHGGAWKLDGYRELRAYIEGFGAKGASLGVIHNVFLNPYRLNNWILQGANGVVIGSGMPTFVQKPFDALKDVVRIDTKAKLQRELQATPGSPQGANGQASPLAATNKFIQEIKTKQQTNTKPAETASNDAARSDSFSNPFDMSAFWQPIIDAGNS